MKEISGILYLHDITKKRFDESLLRDYNIFRKLCGYDAARITIFVTTNWDRVSREEGERHEKQLHDEFWRDFIDRGSIVARSSKNDSSASDITSTVIERNHSLLRVLIQHELVDLLKILPETQAGQTLRFTLKELVATYKAEIRLLQRTANPAHKPTLMKTEARLRQVLAQVDALKIPLSRQIRKWLGLL
jgi:hypothetical protein